VHPWVELRVETILSRLGSTWVRFSLCLLAIKGTLADNDQIRIWFYVKPEHLTLSHEASKNLCTELQSASKMSLTPKVQCNLLSDKHVAKYPRYADTVWLVHVSRTPAKLCFICCCNPTGCWRTHHRFVWATDLMLFRIDL
jgi:hypothetical protein